MNISSDELEANKRKFTVLIAASAQAVIFCSDCLYLTSFHRICYKGSLREGQTSKTLQKVNENRGWLKVYFPEVKGTGCDVLLHHMFR